MERTLTATRARFLCFRGFSSRSTRVLRSCLATRIDRAMEMVELRRTWSSPGMWSYVWSIDIAKNNNPFAAQQSREDSKEKGTANAYKCLWKEEIEK